MKADRRLVLVEGGLGITMLANGFVLAGAAAAGLWWLAALTAVGTFALGWTSDRGFVSEWVTVVLVVAAGAALFAVGLWGGPDLVADAVLPAALAGFGAGLVAYRVCFGLVRPVPEERLQRARERTA